MLGYRSRLGHRSDGDPFGVAPLCFQGRGKLEHALSHFLGPRSGKYQPRLESRLLRPVIGISLSHG